MAGKSQNVRRLSNILRNNTGAKEQISKKKIGKNFELSENENTTYQNVCNTVKAVMGMRKTDPKSTTEASTSGNQEKQKRAHAIQSKRKKRSNRN